MAVSETSDYESILAVVSKWPPARRINLLQDVLKTLVPETQTRRPQRKTLEKALGLLDTGHPAPSDQEIQQWLDEHRIEKYG
jgi:hypothetical protein